MEYFLRYDFPQWKFSLYFMGCFPAETILPEPGTKEAEQFLWTLTSGTVLEFTHNHGSETDESFQVNTGNVEPHRGFGHIAMMTPDVYASCAVLEEKGIPIALPYTKYCPFSAILLCRSSLSKEAGRGTHEGSSFRAGSRWLLGGDHPSVRDFHCELSDDA